MELTDEGFEQFGSYAKGFTNLKRLKLNFSNCQK